MHTFSLGRGTWPPLALSKVGRLSGASPQGMVSIVEAKGHFLARKSNAPCNIEGGS